MRSPMRPLLNVLPVLMVGLAAPILPLGCRNIDPTLGPPGSNAPSRAPDDVAPLHTGGLEATVSSPEGVQGPGADPASHGDPVAGAIATGLALGILGSGAAAVAIDCSRPGATEDCLRGPGTIEKPAPTALPTSSSGALPPLPPTPPSALIPGTCQVDTDCGVGGRCQRENATGPKPKQETFAGAYCRTSSDVCDPANDVVSCGSDAACVYSHTSKRWMCLKGAVRRASD